MITRWGYTVASHVIGHFYALTEQAKQQLMENLRDFSSRLPAGVEQLGPYMEVVPPRPVARDDPNGYGTIPFNQ